MSKPLWVGSVGFVLLVGCAPARTKVRSAAAENFRCPESDVKVKSLKHGKANQLKYELAGTNVAQYRAVGCGRQDTYVEFCPPGVHSGDEQCDWRSVVAIKKAELKKRATFDLRCDESKLTIVSMDSNTSGVSGCGHRVTYVWLCPHDPIYTPSCAWTADVASSRGTSPVQESQAKPKTPAEDSPAPPAEETTPGVDI